MTNHDTLATVCETKNCVIISSGMLSHIVSIGQWILIKHNKCSGLLCGLCGWILDYNFWVKNKAIKVCT